MGFPNTRYRQHATQPIEIMEMTWLPYRGVKTLYIKGLAKNEDREYNSMILFKNVDYETNENTVTISASTGGSYKLKKISLEESDVLVRCNCKDFRYRFGYYNSLDRSLYGNVPTRYESKGIRGPINPTQVSGFCKHIIKLFEVLEQAHLFFPPNPA